MAFYADEPFFWSSAVTIQTGHNYLASYLLKIMIISHQTPLYIEDNANTTHDPF